MRDRRFGVAEVRSSSGSARTGRRRPRADGRRDRQHPRREGHRREDGAGADRRASARSRSSRAAARRGADRPARREEDPRDARARGRNGALSKRARDHPARRSARARRSKTCASAGPIALQLAHALHRARVPVARRASSRRRRGRRTGTTGWVEDRDALSPLMARVAARPRVRSSRCSATGRQVEAVAFGDRRPTSLRRSVRRRGPADVAAIVRSLLEPRRH